MIAPATEWRPVVGFEGRYEVSDAGSVRVAATGRAVKVRVDNRAGYAATCLYRNGRRTDCYVHRLVAAAFIGPCPQGHVVNHKNGVKTDSGANNLEYVTASENTRHAYATGLATPHAGSRKLTDEQVIEIRRILHERKMANARKPTYAEIGAPFGVTEYAVYQIASGKVYKSITAKPSRKART